jgi:pilus assembly protein FimV
MSVSEAPAANGAAAGAPAAGTTGTGGAAGTTGTGGAAGTTGAAGIGPGNAIGTPAMSASGALDVHTSPFPSKHPFPPPGGAAATSGLNKMAIMHNPAPAATNLMLNRSNTAIDADSFNHTRKLTTRI